jgi:hypothetical protein
MHVADHSWDSFEMEVTYTCVDNRSFATYKSRPGLINKDSTEGSSGMCRRTYGNWLDIAIAKRALLIPAAEASRFGDIIYYLNFVGIPSVLCNLNTFVPWDISLVALTVRKS